MPLNKSSAKWSKTFHKICVKRICSRLISVAIILRGLILANKLPTKKSRAMGSAENGTRDALRFALIPAAWKIPTWFRLVVAFTSGRKLRSPSICYSGNARDESESIGIEAKACSNRTISRFVQTWLIIKFAHFIVHRFFIYIILLMYKKSAPQYRWLVFNSL